MKKSTIGIFIGIAVSIFAITTIPGLINYLVVHESSSADSDILYTRVEAERYEFILPTKTDETNSYYVYAGGEFFDQIQTISPITFKPSFSIPGGLGSSNQIGLDVPAGVNADLCAVLIHIKQVNNITYGWLAVNEGAFGLYDLSAVAPVDGLYVISPTPIYEYVLFE